MSRLLSRWGFSLVVLSAAVGLAPTTLLASGIDNLSNLSVDYMRHFARNASTGTASGVAYNPAGLTHLEPGFHLSLENQSFFNDYRHEVGDREYSANNPVPLVPSFFAVYAAPDWAGFFALTIPAGGGSLEYENGSATTDLMVTEARALGMNDIALSSGGATVYYGATLGGAYALNEIVSVAAGLRFIYATRELHVDTTTPLLIQLGGQERLLDQRESSRGVGGIVGVHLSLPGGLEAALRYETVTRLRWTVDKSDAPTNILALMSAETTAALRRMLPEAGSHYDRDLPAHGALGVTYEVLPSLQLASSLDYYFQRSADWDGREKDHKDGWEVSFGAEYQVIPALLLSAGAAYGEPGPKKRAYVAENPGLPGYTLGGGAVVRVLDSVSLKGAVAHTLGLPRTRADGVRLTKLEAWSLSLGVECRVP